MKIAILFNGAPGSGKDTCAKIFNDLCYLFDLDSDVRRFKDKLYKGFCSIYGLDEKDFINRYETDRIYKDTSNPVFNGMSPRQALIHYAEEIVKPRSGSNYYAQYEADKIEDENIDEKDQKYYIFSDLGFVEELEEIHRVCDEVHVFSVHRDEYDFKNDSRDYVTLPYYDKNIQYYVIENNKTKEDLIYQILELIHKYQLFSH